MILKNKFYDAGKWLVIIFLPSLALFINGLGDIYPWLSLANELVATINLVTVFLGTILQISSYKYQAKCETGGQHYGE